MSTQAQPGQSAKASDYKKIIDLYREDLTRVEKSIADNFSSDVAMIPTVSSYLIGGGGKRIRPLLVIATSRLCGYTGSTRHITLSVVAEYIHAATLLHDDVVDVADLRRGAESANIKYGNQASVLVGDFLFATSFKLMSEDSDTRIIDTMSAATKHLAEGEILQLVNTCNLENTEKAYMDTIFRKTAALMEACCRAGAILSGADRKTEEAVARYGKNIGMAFQLVDDALDFSGDESLWGKPLGADLAEGKVTLPLIKALASANQPEKETIRRVIESDEALKSGDVVAVIEILNKYDSLKQTMTEARAHIEEAKSSLSGFDTTEHKEALCQIADYIASRKV